MTFLGKLAGGVLRGQGWPRSTPLLRGCLSAAALVASVDGTLSLAKRNRLDQILDELSGAQSFDLHRAVEFFESELGRIRADGRAGRSAALGNLQKTAGDEGAVALVLRVAQAIALADGAASPHAKSAVGDIAAALSAPAPDLSQAAAPQSGAARVIVIGNEKGGTGKSTAAIHIATGLAVQGKAVACLDLDGRQATLSRFLQYRSASGNALSAGLAVPRYRRIEPSAAPERAQGEQEERSLFEAAMTELRACEAIVIDTPGYNSHLARLAHARANVVVTPINDSFIDIDALADIDRERHEVRAPSNYCRMVWQEKEDRALRGGAALDWIVTRNRVGQLDSRNTREMAALLDVLARRMGFHLEPGFSERVVFRELFFRGMTLFDLAEEDVARSGRASLKRAKSEAASFLAAVTAPADHNTKAQRD
ncbi:AAA family ATPase [Pelagibius litoralis]|uniref:AAA family ATPase n=1 Tax=Pelagibius litoralis TaxID=374515 RepID=A0A967CC48_9PROT|nr:division plane positioning ATPase MipZ [Pelagibius litoralis]NIA68818.1 AAA family ATPase [Pelagibius litoralis]